MEFDADAGDIRGVRHHGDAAGGNVAHLAFDHTKDDVDIVDHEVEDDADLGAAGVELRQAMDLDKKGVERDGLNGEIGGVKAFDMAHLELYVRFPDELYDLAGFFHGVGKGFFHKYVFAFADRFLAEVEVEWGGGHDIYDIAGIHEGVGVGEAWELVFLGYFRGIDIFRVIESNQLRLFDL